jgi:6-phosphogluconolactonase
VAAAGTKLRVEHDVERLALAVARAFVEAAKVAVRERGRFTVALSGGHTPVPLYRALAAAPPGDISWADVHLFWSDERFVSPDAAESNYRMARETLLSGVSIPAENVHRPETELDDPGESARRYEDDIRAFFGSSPPRLDWILLGLGEDGHVASLFPGSSALEERQRIVLAVRDAPKPPATRLTMTLPLIDAGREIHFLVSGRDKQEILYRVLGASDGPLPAQRVHPTEGIVHWWVDRLAATRMPDPSA